MTTDNKKIFICCEKCGKRLIQRLPNGLWHFCFGRGPDGMGEPVVDLLIHGSLKMVCLRRTCRHENTLNYLPNQNLFGHVDNHKESA